MKNNMIMVFVFTSFLLFFNGVAKAQNYSIDNYVEENHIDTIVGEKGKLTPPQPLKSQGIVLKWEFNEISDNPYIYLDKNGNWESLKSGETEIQPAFFLSDDSNEELQRKNIQLETTSTDIARYVLFNIKNNSSKIKITLENKLEENTINTTVGEQGKLTPIQPLKDQGTILDWEFQEITDNPYISLDKNGNWKALKEGKFEFLPIFSISDSSLQKLKQEGIELEAIVSEAAIYVNFNIQNIPKKTSTTDNNTNNKLPRTNEINNKGVLLFGLLIIYGTMIYKFNKKIDY